MAEFNELVQIKKRICIKYKSSGCIGCPIKCSSGDLCGIISISGYSNNKFMELEEVLLSWAAEHPEPVYPAWGDWFAERGDLIKLWRNIKVCSGHGPGVIGFLYEPIPTDIASQLGIKPKDR